MDDDIEKMQRLTAGTADQTDSTVGTRSTEGTPVAGVTHDAGGDFRTDGVDEVAGQGPAGRDLRTDDGGCFSHFSQFCSMRSRPTGPQSTKAPANFAGDE